MNVYSSFPDFEEKQNRFRALRSRQDLFQEEGVLNMILDTIDKFSLMEALPDFAGIIGEETHVSFFGLYSLRGFYELIPSNLQMMWEEIATYLYLLVAAMIKGNHYNCAQFAAAQRLDWLFGRLSNPQSAEGKGPLAHSSRELNTVACRNPRRALLCSDRVTRGAEHDQRRPHSLRDIAARKSRSRSEGEQFKELISIKGSILTSVRLF